ncbi:Phosphoenolpyruvate carboxykinase [Senna tora]|uniref:Phosphoenolpyruvate carboxykinase n=1 Tax=Senna tora TaxID=362788 RepID=A0A834XHI9_9FABA|nr:Phosphoenolpyruvate carboxykinase [Senna tora]
MILICIPNPRNENAMRNLLLNRLIQTSFTRSSKSTSLPFLLASRRNVVSAPPGEDEVGSVVFSSGLSWALASKGVIVKGKAFQNLKPSELKQLGATIAECLSGFSVYVRGSVVSGAPDISKAQFGKLVKQSAICIQPLAESVVYFSITFHCDSSFTYYFFCCSPDCNYRRTTLANKLVACEKLDRSLIATTTNCG